MMEQRVSDEGLNILLVGTDELVRRNNALSEPMTAIINLALDLRDTRAALAASEAREKGLREGLEAAFREGYSYGDRDEDPGQAGACWLDSDAFQALTQTPIESTKGGK